MGRKKLFDHILTPAERMKRMREKVKADPDRKQAYLEKENERVKKYYLAESERDLRTIRRKWRNQKRQLRKKEKEQQLEMVREDKNTQLPVTTRQKVQGRKLVKRLDRRCEKKLANAELEIVKLKKVVNRFRVKLHRCNRMKNTTSPKSWTPQTSPRSNSLLLLRKYGLNPRKCSHLLKQLIFADVMEEEIRAATAATKSKREHKTIARIVSGKICKTYRMMSTLSKATKLSRTILLKRKALCRRIVLPEKQRIRCIVSGIKEKVLAFYNDDTNSRTTTGKKETKTRNKRKEQKRLLCDTLENLHKKFLDDNPTCHLSYQSFCRIRPFWVVAPTEKDRETCACITHENFRLKIEPLVKKGVFQSRNVSSYLEDVSRPIVDKDTVEDTMIRLCQWET